MRVVTLAKPEIMLDEMIDVIREYINHHSVASFFGIRIIQSLVAGSAFRLHAKFYTTSLPSEMRTAVVGSG